MSRSFRIAYFAHSLRSDWNNGNAHFLRGLLRSLGSLGMRSHYSSREQRLVDRKPSRGAGGQAVAGAVSRKSTLTCTSAPTQTRKPIAAVLA